MLKRFPVILALMATSLTLLAVEVRHGVLVGEVLKVDNSARTMVVKTADGGQHTLRFVARTAVYGAEAAAAGAKDGFRGLRQGSEVAVHYTTEGTKETADEIDSIGKSGLHSTEASAVHLDRGARTLTVKTEHGGEETYQLTEDAARDIDKDVSSDAGKSEKVTVYYTEEAGHKVAHFLKRAI